MRTAILLSFLVCGFLPSISCSRSAPASADAATRYVCPMHPAVVQGRPGECPICGMDLVLAKEPAKAAPAGAGGAAHVEGAPMRAPGAATSDAGITVSADQQKVLGVTVSEVAASAASRALRLVGRVVPDESRLYRVNAGIEGSIRDLSSATTGSRVRKDQILGTFYAPNALSMIQLFIVNTQGRERAMKRHAEGTLEGEGESLGSANIQQRTMQLENLGMSAAQRDEIAKSGKVPDTIQIRSPADGFVLARNVSVGQKFDRGEELFRIADLRRVWVLADVFMHEAQHVRAGMRAQVTLPEQGRTFPAKVTQVLPQFDAATRTLKVRLELDNPDFTLRPDMFVDVTLAVELAPGIAVPADAIVDSGLAKLVFVQTADGVFEPRRVETGWRSGDRVEVVRGLAAGEKIVTSGTFFLDSETRLRSPSSGAAEATDLVPVPTGHEDRSPGGAGSSPSRPQPPAPGHPESHGAGPPMEHTRQASDAGHAVPPAAAARPAAEGHAGHVVPAAPVPAAEHAGHAMPDAPAAPAPAAEHAGHAMPAVPAAPAPAAEPAGHVMPAAPAPAEAGPAGHADHAEAAQARAGDAP